MQKFMICMVIIVLIIAFLIVFKVSKKLSMMDEDLMIIDEYFEKENSELEKDKTYKCRNIAKVKNGKIDNNGYVYVIGRKENSVFFERNSKEVKLNIKGKNANQISHEHMKCMFDEKGAFAIINKNNTNSTYIVTPSGEKEFVWSEDNKSISLYNGILLRVGDDYLKFTFPQMKTSTRTQISQHGKISIEQDKFNEGFGVEYER